MKHQLNKVFQSKQQMNVRNLPGIFICLLAFVLLIPGSCFAQQVSAQQTKYRIPVLEGKDFNPVIRIRIDVGSDDKDIYLQQLRLSTKATGTSDAIKCIKIFHVQQDSAIYSSEKLDQKPLFAELNGRADKNLALNGNLKLQPGANYFWVAVGIGANTKLTDRLSVNVTSALVNGRTLNLSGSNDSYLHRVGVAVRLQQQDNVHTSRIPGLATGNDGTLYATYDARRTKGGDLQGDIDIALNRSVDHGNTWLPMQVVLDMGAWGGLPQKFNGVSDACILVDKNTGHIFVAGLWMYGVLDSNGKWIEGLNNDSANWNHQWRDKGSQPGFDEKQTSQFLITKSTDNGKTWSEPVNLTKMCKKESWWLWAPAPGKGITLKDGTLVFPTQGRDDTGKPFSNITYSKDRGVTWKTSNPATSEATTENMAVELSDGSIMLNMRTNSNKGRLGDDNGRSVAVTTDLGQTWKVHPTSRNALPEPVCMASIIRHDYTIRGKKKSILVFSNPNSKTQRNHMTVKVSYDDGLTWPKEKQILLDELSGRGYSCLTSVDEDTIGILYEGSQAHMIFQTIKLKELL
jgi:sialidase-1